ncbi:MAG: 3-deoxy-manno-octulosonate cytidylyltransferase [Candidatus Omnitrophota bacterium]|nr:MAG: 3-deoxy-manno-octulosonate cytidylyltransferase [Candidatus Omnitrophota bacterium]
MYNVIGVIPARYASTRLPYKLTKNILGKPLLQWTWQSACSAHSLDKILIACDDSSLKEMAEGFGAEAVLTSSDHTSGTDRVAEAVSEIDARVVINIQADEPLIHPSVINTLAEEMLADSKLMMGTARKKIVEEDEINNPNVVKVVTDKDGYALYFSRFPIPYHREEVAQKQYDKHLGIYAYTKDFLYEFKNLPPSYLERAEKLEQLRALEAGYKIKVIESQFDSWGVDTEEDLKHVEKILSERGCA